eukprot:scaffold5908_cov152-Skeletonema_marinoi.AAC.8
MSCGGGGRWPKIISITSVLRSVTVEVAIESSRSFVFKRHLVRFPHITISTLLYSTLLYYL